MRDIITEKVAAGLRAMNKKPAGFVFIDIEGDEEGWTWDEPTILGFIVMKMLHHRKSNRNICRFVPLGSTESSITSIDRSRFAKAYNDYQLAPVPCPQPKPNHRSQSMRAIKFRAKRCADDKWVFGNLECHGNDLQNPDRAWITTTEPASACREVCPETIGQWTGLKDINGVEIYEGDIDSKGMVFTYDTDMGGWYRMLKGEGVQWHGQAVLNGKLPFEITGNIHDVVSARTEGSSI